MFTPTYTGLGERSHLANPGIGLETHIRDVLQVIEYEGLSGFVLVGHSYGGMVATGVADRVADRIASLIYLDAFVPGNGECLFDFQSAEVAARMRAAADAEGEGWRIPPGPLSADVTPDDAAWLAPRRGPQPLKAFEERIRLAGKAEGLPKAYVYCTAKPADDPFRPVADRVRQLGHWRYFEIASGHTPNITQPKALAALLDTIVAG